MRYTVRPLSDRTWLRYAHQRQQSRFDSPWSSTLSLLGREIDQLGGRDVVIEVDVPERGIRNDGMLRADAKPAMPAVVVAFETRQHGPMLYRCDRYVAGYGHRPRGDSWQHNVRAIALTLEALRAVDRYGATETGQQYQGFKALPGGQPIVPEAPTMTQQEACHLLSELSGVTITPGESSQSVRARHRTARAAAHPDRNGGDQSLWDQVEEAARVLGVSQ